MSSTLAALLLFLTAVSIDSLTAGLTYGTRRVQIRLPAYLILIWLSCRFFLSPFWHS